LHERTNAKGKKVYDIVFGVFDIEGNRKQKWLRGYESKTLAKQGYLLYVDKYCEVVRHAPKKKKNPEKEKLLVGDLVRQYLASLGNVNKQSGIYDKENIFGIYILPFFEETPIANLTKEELYRWQDNLWNMRNKKTGKYYSYKYLTKIRGNLNAFLEWCAQRYGVENHLKEVIKPKRQGAKKEMKFWTREQFDQFIAVVDNDTYHALFTFMFFTGRRKGELFALYKTDISHDKITFDKSVNRRTYGANSWEITTTKEDKTDTIPICKIVQDEIKRYNPPKEGKFYFGGKEPLAPTSVTRAFNRYTEIAGLPRIRIHDFRHSFVSMLIHLGANLMVVADLISDNVEQVTKTYGHMYEQDKLDIVSRIV
jgi:integrase